MRTASNDMLCVVRVTLSEAHTVSSTAQALQSKVRIVVLILLYHTTVAHVSETPSSAIDSAGILELHTPCVVGICTLTCPLR